MASQATVDKVIAVLRNNVKPKPRTPVLPAHLVTNYYGSGQPYLNSFGRAVNKDYPLPKGKMIRAGDILTIHTLADVADLVERKLAA